MDLSTLIGLILGAAFLLISMVLGGSLLAYLDPASVLIVFGGAGAAVLISFPLQRLFKMPGVIRKAFFSSTPDALKIIRQMVEFAEVARRDGILALEGMTEQMNDPFIVRGVQMAVDGTDPEVIQQVMETELENQMDRHEGGKLLLESYGKYAPAYGMIGTVVGLVAMLGNMEDPSQIGAGMAVALLTTLYGAVVANLVCLPIADKLAIRSAEETLIKTIIVQGVMSIQSGDNPRNVESKLMTFLTPNERARAEAMKEAA